MENKISMKNCHLWDMFLSLVFYIVYLFSFTVKLLKRAENVQSLGTPTHHSEHLNLTPALTLISLF